MRMPNGALASLAGNVDPHHQVAMADLVLMQQAVAQTVVRLMRDVQPEVVGCVGDDISAAHRAGDHAFDQAA